MAKGGGGGSIILMEKLISFAFKKFSLTKKIKLILTW